MANPSLRHCWRKGGAAQQRDEAHEVRDGQDGAALAADLSVGRTKCGDEVTCPGLSWRPSRSYSWPAATFEVVPGRMTPPIGLAPSTPRHPLPFNVVHSKYWRSAHWSYECQYFFQIRGDPEFRREFFVRNTLEQLSASSAAEAMRDPFQHQPAWFCPKHPQHCDVWVYRDPPAGNFKVIIDRETGDLFLTDYQV